MRADRRCNSSEGRLWWRSRHLRRRRRERRRGWPGTTRTCCTSSTGAGCACCTASGTARSTPWTPSKTKSSCSASSSPSAPSLPRWIPLGSDSLIPPIPHFSFFVDPSHNKPSLLYYFGSALIKEILGCPCCPDKVVLSTASAPTPTS